MKKFILVFAVLGVNAAFAETANGHIETAARMNVAENLCDINFGQTRGVVFHVCSEPLS